MISTSYVDRLRIFASFVWIIKYFKYYFSRFITNASPLNLLLTNM